MSLKSARSGRLLAMIGLTTALGCGALAAPAMASAAIPDFSTGTLCNGDACMVLQVTGSPAHAFVIAGANSEAFQGYFHISGPGGPFPNSQTKTWAAHGLGSGNDDYHTAALDPDHGTYCVTAFASDSSPDQSLGKVCGTY
jgi:hypothetical protein